MTPLVQGLLRTQEALGLIPTPESNWMWQLVPVIPALHEQRPRELRHPETHSKFEASRGDGRPRFKNKLAN